MNLSEFRGEAYFCESNSRMGDLLGSLVWGAKSGQYCVIGGGSLQIVSEPLPSLRWWERTQAHWGTPAGTLGPKRGWLWRLTSPGNEDVLICINAPFMTQRVLKLWWLWTYQSFAVERTSARAIPGWVTSWEVWFGKPKADNIVSLGVSRYKINPNQAHFIWRSTRTTKNITIRICPDK
jgi:hypothetical protein